MSRTARRCLALSDVARRSRSCGRAAAASAHPLGQLHRQPLQRHPRRARRDPDRLRRRHGGDPDVPGDARRSTRTATGRCRRPSCASWATGQGPAPRREPHPLGRRAAGVARGPLAPPRACATARAGLPILRFEGVFAAPRRSRRGTSRTATTTTPTRSAGGRSRPSARTARRSRVPTSRPQSVSDALLSLPAGPPVEPAARHVDARVLRARAASIGSIDQPDGARSMRRGPASTRSPFAVARGQPRDRAGPARVRAGRGVRRLARPAARAREDADGRVHGRLRDEGAAGRRPSARRSP